MKPGFQRRCIAVLGAFFIIVTARQVAGLPDPPPCIEGGPYRTPSSCVQAGTVVNAGALNYLVTNICAGSSVSAPFLKTNVTFSTGVESDHITTDCSGDSFENSTVTYSVGSLYFTPTNFSWPSSITGPFNTPGTYYYRAQVNGTPSGGVCSTLVATVATVVITVTSSPPVIITQPVSQTVTIGTDASFTVVGTGCPSVFYQWKLWGTNLVGATGTSLTISNVQFANGGNYTVVLSNLSGSVTSSVAVLTTRAPVCTNISGMVSWWPGETNIIANDVVGTNDGILIGTTGFTNGEVNRAFRFIGTNGGIKVPASGSMNVGASGGFTLEAWINPQNVSIRSPLFEWNTGNGVTYWGVHFYIDPVTSSGTVPGTLYANIQGIGDVWHQMWSSNGVARSNVFQHVALTYDKTSGLATMYYNGTVAKQQNFGSFTPKTTNDFYLGKRPLSPGNEQYDFAGVIDEPTVYNRALSAGEILAIYNANITGKCPVLKIVGPTNVATCPGSPVTLTVTPSGCGGLTYIWKLGTNVLTGQTNSSLTLSSVSSTNAGTYSVIVSGFCGTLTNSATLTVLTKVSATGPVDVSVCAGSSASFAVTASGSGPFTYQWLFGTNILAGKTTNTLTVTNVGPANIGTYSVTVSGACGTITKSANLLPLPIGTQPTNQMVTYGDNAIFSVVASGSSPTYQWRKNGVNISGATASSYTVVKPTVSVSGEKYDVIVVGSSCTATSSPANLLVLRKVIIVKADDKERTYGLANPTLTFSFSGFVSGETVSVLSGVPPTLSCSATPTSPVAGSPYAITLSGGSLGAANYAVRYVAGQLIVDRAVLTITANNATREYGLPNPTFTYAYSGFVNGENQSVLVGVPTLTSIAVVGSAVSGSPYIINASATQGDETATLTAANYNFHFVSARLAITRATLSVTANDKARNVGDSNPTLDGVITGLRNSDPITVNYTTTATTGSTVGAYPIVPAWSDPSGKLANYTETRINGTLTVGPARINLTSGDMSYTLGSPPTTLDPNVTLTTTGMANFANDNLTVSFVASQDKDNVSILNYGDGLDEVGTTNNSGTYNVTYGDDNSLSTPPIVVGTYSGGTPATPLVIHFNSSATPTRVGNVLKKLTYYNTSQSPLKTQRRIKMLFTDNSGNALCPPVFRNVDVDCPNAIDVMLIIDKTDSMSTKDIPGHSTLTRLDVAKSSAISFLNFIDFPQDTVAVMSFPAKNNHTIAAASTYKHDTTNGYFRTVISDVSTPINNITSPGGDTVYHPSLGEAWTNLLAIRASGRLQVLVFLTDGEINPPGDAPLSDNQYKQLALDQTRAFRNVGVRTVTIGLGGEIGGTSGAAARAVLSAMASSPDDFYLAAGLDLNTVYAGIAGYVCRNNIRFGTSSLNYLENTPATVLDSNFQVNDPSSTSYNNNVLTFALSPTLAEDQLAIGNQGTGPGQINVSGSNVRYGTTVIGTFTGQNSGTLAITFNTVATLDAVVALTHDITYYNTSDVPSTAVRTVTATITDGSGGTSLPTTMTINVIPVDDPPTISFVALVMHYTETQSPQFLDPTLTLNDIDSANFQDGSLTIDFSANGQPEDRLGIATAGSISVSGTAVSYSGTQIGTVSGGSGTAPLVIKLNANATVAATLALARNLTYYNVSQSPSPLTRTVRAILDDGDGGTSPPTTIFINVIEINNTPVAVADSYAVDQSGTLTVAAPGVLLNDSDMEGNALTVSVVTAPVHGALTLNPDGSFVYIPNSSSGPTETFTYRITDNGTTGGSPDPKSATATDTITINPPACVAQGISSLTFPALGGSPTVTGGTSVQVTVTLADVTTYKGGQAITLSSDKSSAIPPVSVIVPQGSKTASFTLETLTVTADTVVTLTASYPGKAPATATLTLAAPIPQKGASLPTDQPSGYKYSLFIDNLPFSEGGAGPIGIAKNSLGQVLVSFPEISEMVILPDADGQHYDAAINQTIDTKENAIFGLARLDGKIYGVTLAGNVFEIADDGTIVRTVWSGSGYAFIGLAACAQKHLLYVSAYAGRQVYEINPISGTFRTVVEDTGSVEFDGIAISPDGGTVYCADNKIGDNRIRGYDVPTGGLVLDIPADHGIDGIAVGQGNLSGTLFVNCNDGTLLEVDIETGTLSVFSSQQVGRGDFIAIDDDGSLWLTQSLKILRLTPPPGSSFGTLKGTVVTREDLTTGYSTLSPGTGTEVVSTKATDFDLRGISGQLTSASITRAGTINYVAAGGFDLECGIAPLDTLLTQNSYATRSHYGSSGGASVDYSITWPLPPDYAQNLQLNLGSDYNMNLADRVSSVCGSLTLADTPQTRSPQARNELIFETSGATSPQIPVGTALDIALFGSDAPVNSGWDIVLKGTVVASSGNPNGWNVEPDHTTYQGAFVSVPLTATISDGYEMRLTGTPARSGGFEVVTASGTFRASILQPIVLSVNPISAGGSLTGTISLDRPAPSGGATIALSSGSGSVSVPSSVTIAAGAISQNVSVTVSSGASAGNVLLTASYNGIRQASLRVKTGTGSPPSPPTVTASAAPRAVTLMWTPVTGLTYNLKRSRNHTGPYTTIFTGATGPSFLDTGVINGLAYYYVVSAQSDYGEGANSAEVSATPTSGQVDTPVITFDTFAYTIKVSEAVPGALIHYTLDGSEPTEGSPVYKGTFFISTTTTIKAKAYKTGYLPSNVATHTETITVTPFGNGISCGYYSSSEPLSPYGQSSWARGQAFFANHYSLGSFAANSKILVTMTSSDFDSVLYLYDDSGNLLASNDDDGTGGVNSKIVYTVPSSPAGSYYIEATTKNLGQTGNYTIYLDCGTTPPQIAVVDSANSSIANGATISVGTSGNVFPNTLATFGISIKNSASASTGSGLNIGRLQMTGDFAINQQLVPELPPQQVSSPITVSLISSTLGAKSGTLTIPSDDTAHSPYVIHFASTVVDPNLFPSVSITTPANHDTISDSSSITVTANATTTEFPIVNVEFFATLSGHSAVKIGQSTTSPYTMKWVGPQAGAYTLVATVTDTQGRQSSSSAITITVNAPTLTGTPVISPSPATYSGGVTATISRNDLPPDATLIYTTDADPSPRWYIYQQPFILNHDDFASGSADAHVTLRARGMKGSLVSSIASAAFTITGRAPSHPPAAEIDYPTDGQQILGPVSVKGLAYANAGDPDFQSWRLEYRQHPQTDLDSGTWTTFASGNGSVSSAGSGPSEFDSGHMFDPTLLLNGLYDIRLSAVNVAGDTTPIEIPVNQITVDVEGHQKIGNFTLSFVDMTVPVAGIPVQVTRTYDSRDKGQGDFGIGWRLALSNVKVQKSGILGEGWDQELSGYLGLERQIIPLETHRVTITFPDDRVYSFEATLNPSLAFGDILFGKVVFNPLPGTHASLAPVDEDSEVDVVQDGDDGWQFTFTDDSVEKLFDPAEFDLTTADGRIFRISMSKGLEQITDLNQTVISFQADGVYKTTAATPTPAKIISYTREVGGLNRITAITDPNNKSVQYHYGTGTQSPQDLVQVIDRASQPTSFSYDTIHNLIDVVAPNNSHGARNFYDDLGRLTKTVSPQNDITTYAYADHSETITDPLGNATTLTYDDNGNIVNKSQTVLIDGVLTTAITTSEFSDSGNPTKPTKITDALNRTTTFTYSPAGNVISKTDPLGHTVSYSYNQYGQQTSHVLANDQEVSQMHYNARGNLVSTLNARGAQIIYTYNADGTMTTSTDAQNHLTQYAYGENINIIDPATGNSISVAGDPGNAGKATTVTDANSHQTHYVFDKNGHQTHSVTTRTLNNGSVETIDTLNEFDDAGHLVKITAYAHVPGQAVQSQVSVQNFYDEIGKIDHVIDYTGQQTSYLYDSAGRLIRTTRPDGNSTTNGYDANGQQISSTINTTDNKHLTTRYAYDGLGRQISITYPDGSVSSQVFDLASQLIKSVDQNGNVTRYEYDDAGNNIKIIDALNHVTTFEYDENGRNVAMSDANEHKISYTYDEAGQLTNTAYPLDSYQVQTYRSTSYNVLGQKVSETDQAGIVTGYAYDALGRLSYVTNASGTADQAITQYQYDEVGNLVKQFDANQFGKPAGSQVATIFDYDFLGRPVKRTLPDGKTEQMSYPLVANPDPLGSGNVLRILETDFNGKTTTVEEDVMGRPSKITPDPSLPSAINVQNTFSYDPATGQRHAMVDASGTTTYKYDLMGRLTNKVHSVVGDLNYTYDSVGNLLQIQSSHQSQGGVVLNYHWDALNRLVQVDDNVGKSTTYSYDSVGNVKNCTFPLTTPVVTSYVFDDLNRLTSAAVKQGSITVASFDYNPADHPLGANGNRMAARETINTATPINRSVNYYYDNRRRLTKEEIASSSEATPRVGAIDYTAQTGGYNGYDAAGNRRSRVVSLSPALTGFGTVTSTFDANDRVIGATYDFNGNTTVESLPTLSTSPTQPVQPATGSPDQYDFQNHLVQRSDGSATVKIVYDGDGNRKSKVVTGSNPDTRYYLVDDQNPTGRPQVLEELVPNGASLMVTRVYNYGLSLISQSLKSGASWNVSYYGCDGHGNVRFLLDGAQNPAHITDTYTYDAYGVLINRTGSTANNYLYCGEQFDFDLGLYYLRARYYKPDSGRFWTKDSFGGSEEDPISLHKYLYVADNPVNGADPSGLYSDYRQYLGYEAEYAIQEEYSDTHLGQDEFIFYGKEQGTIDDYLKPDIFNTYPTEKHFLEIKPISYSGVSKGIAKLALNTVFFKPAGITADGKWQSRTPCLRTPNGDVIFVINLWGIVFYQDIDDLEWELILVAVITVPQDLLDYLMCTSIDALEELAPVYARARAMQAGLATMENAEIGSDWSTGTLNATQGAE